MTDQKISQLADAGTPQDTDQLVLARSGSTLSLLFSSLKAAIPGGVTSVFGRTGAVSAQAGDYTAAQVTNAADKSSSSQQAFTGEVKAPDFATSGLTGATRAARFVGATTSGAPASGTFALGDFVIAQNGHIFVCTVAGSPGTWVDVGSVSNQVTSIFGRTGAVTAQSGDYTLNQIGAATGDYSINSHKLTNLTDPASAQDAATKAYVDAATPGNGGGKGHLTTATAANSPADLAPGADGTVLTADSTQSVGLKWATSGGLVKLFSTTLNATGALDTGASAIPTGHGSLYVVFICRDANAGVRSAAYTLRVNGDSGTNYDANYQYFGQTGSSGQSLSQTSWNAAGLIISAGGTASYADIIIVEIPFYDNATFFKTGFMRMVMPDTNGTRTAILGLGWKSTAAINQITLDTASHLLTGSSMTVYGTE